MCELDNDGLMMINNTEQSCLSDLEKEDEETFLVPSLAFSPLPRENISPHQLVFYLQLSPALPGPDEGSFIIN